MEETENKRAIVVLSGGLDSTTALYWALTRYNVVGAISFDYGQRHKEELKYAQETVKRLNEEKKLNIEHRIQSVDISDNRSSLANKEIDVPYGHYANESMNKTVVNNRNSILFSLATAWAIVLQADRVVVGIHSGDHFIYPDCRTDYIIQFGQVMKLANEGFISSEFSFMAPFVSLDKTDIAELAVLLGVPIEKTYSDYEGGGVQNAQSGTSVERIEAISLAWQRVHTLESPFTSHHKSDTTEYTNKEYALNLLISKAKEDRLNQIQESIKGYNYSNFNVTI